jgi:hypothetical protein
LRDHLRQLPGLKAGCAGDIGPQPSDHVFERAGLYFDTIIVPDPLLQVAALDSESMLRNDYYLVKYGIIQCQHRDVYLADITPPIAYLLGDVGMLKASATGAEPFNLAFLDCVMLVNQLYGTDFDSYDEVIDHFERFATDEEALRNLARPELFLLDQEAERTPEAQWAAAVEHLAEKSLALDGLRGKGASLIGNVLMGRMSQATDILCRTVEQGFHPLVTAPRAYYWLTEKIRLNQKYVGEALGIEFKELAVTNSLLSDQNRWLGNLTLDQLITLRRRNELGDLRAELTRNLDDIAKASLVDFNSLVTQVDWNLKSTLEKHHDKLKALDRNLRQSLAISVPSLLFSIIAAFQPTMGVILPSWAAGLVGATSLKELISGFVAYRRDRQSLARSPVGILWTAKKVN